MAYIGNVPAEKYTALTQQTFSTPTGTSFTLSQAVTNSVDIDLYIDNVKQDPTTYSVSGTALTTSTIASPSTMYCIYNGRTTETVNPPDDSVGLAQLAGGTDGNIISFDASGNPAYVATGSDGQVLTSTGAGSPPAFEALPASGSWVLIGTVVASDSAGIGITGLDSTYDTYAIGLSDVAPAIDSDQLGIRLGDSSGYDSGASDYTHTYALIGGASGTYSASGDATSSYIQINYQTGLSAGEGMGAMLYLSRPGDGTMRPAVHGTQITINHSSLQTGGLIMGMRNAVITVDRVQLLSLSGNILRGRMTVWGISHG